MTNTIRLNAQTPQILGMSDDTGLSNSDGITSDNLLGTAEANATVEIFIDGSSVGTTTADASGNWTFNHGLNNGSYSITANATDVAGNTGNTSSGFNLTVDTTLGLTQNKNNTFTLTVYPSPSNDFIRVNKLTKIEGYSIYNNLGQKVKKGVISNKEQIDIRDFADGL